MVVAKVFSMVGHDRGNGHVPVFLVLHPTWTISTYYFPVSCGVAEDHCLWSPQVKDEVEEVEKIWEEDNAVVRAATLVAKKGRTWGVSSGVWVACNGVLDLCIYVLLMSRKHQKRCV